MCDEIPTSARELPQFATGRRRTRLETIFAISAVKLDAAAPMQIEAQIINTLRKAPNGIKLYWTLPSIPEA